MKDPLSCDYREAALNHLRDALALSPAQRWHWLREAMDFGASVARARAAQGLKTTGPHGDVIWSPELQAEFSRRLRT